jgi:KUP system potassium uptake protein
MWVNPILEVRTDKGQNLIVFDHSVLKAFSPYFAGEYFMRNKTEGWKSLGGILLCFTGCEALFADLGAFSKR